MRLKTDSVNESTAKPAMSGKMTPLPPTPLRKSSESVEAGVVCSGHAIPPVISPALLSTPLPWLMKPPSMSDGGSALVTAATAASASTFLSAAAYAAS